MSATEVPTAVAYNGKFLTDMTREELITALLTEVASREPQLPQWTPEQWRAFSDHLLAISRRAPDPPGRVVTIRPNY